MVLLFFTHCKEEPVQPKEVNSTAEILAAKLTSEAQLAQLLDNDKAAKKERLEKLKAELKIPFKVLKKPNEALREYLAARKANKTFQTAGKNVNQKSVMQALCNPIYVDFWMLDKYTPKSGSLGIEPSPSYQRDLNFQAEVKNTYGFTNAILCEMGARDNINNNNSPFAGTDIYLAFDMSDVGPIYSCLNAWDKGPVAGCYIDEPTEDHSLEMSVQLLEGVRNAIKNKFGWGTPIVVGDRTAPLMDWNDHLADAVTFTHWTDYHYYGPCSYCYYWGEADQRDAWDAFGNSFGGKLNNLWIYDDDNGELCNLVSYAVNNGKNIWLYNPSWNTIYNFCNEAWQHGYLYQVIRKYQYEYTYVGTGDPCTDDNEEHWLLTDFIRTSITQTN